jgi:3-phenylpropionate/cinnamic acid dioxygenase small subunit
MDESALKMLLDERAISRLLCNYATGVDTRNWPLYESIFDDNIEIDYSSWQADAIGTVTRDQFVAICRGIFGFESTQHIIVNHMIDVKGDEADVVAYMRAQHFLPNNRGENYLTMGGFYTHHLVRKADGWKIDRAKLTVTWLTGNPAIFEIAAKRVVDGF